MKRIIPAIALSGLVLGLCAVTFAFPKPSVQRVAWELNLEHGAPTRIAVKAPGDSAPKAYWYLPITVTNNTDREQQFLPEIELVDDNGRVFRSDKEIPKAVFDEIKRVSGKKLLMPLGKASGPIRQGPDEAVDTVAIWPEPLERMGSFSIFISGLSGESIWYDAKERKELHPSPEGQRGMMTWYRDGVALKDPNDPEKKKDWQVDWTQIKPEAVGEVLRKSYQLDYQVPGDEFYAGKDAIIPKGKNWVMR